ncbi:MAG: hypothetical protein WKG00_29425 [Polyangiaceae bacterium]
MRQERVANGDAQLDVLASTGRELGLDLDGPERVVERQAERELDELFLGRVWAVGANERGLRRRRLELVDADAISARALADAASAAAMVIPRARPDRGPRRLSTAHLTRSPGRTGVSRFAVNRQAVTERRSRGAATS